jgi:hypothetical protein
MALYSTSPFLGPVLGESAFRDLYATAEELIILLSFLVLVHRRALDFRLHQSKHYMALDLLSGIDCKTKFQSIHLHESQLTSILQQWAGVELVLIYLFAPETYKPQVLKIKARQ